MPGVVKNDSVEFLVSEIISPTYERRWVALNLAGAGREDYDGFVGHVSDVITYGVVMKESWKEKQLGECNIRAVFLFRYLCDVNGQATSRRASRSTDVVLPVPQSRAGPASAGHRYTTGYPGSFP